MDLSKKDSFWKEKALFNELIHFSTVLPFHLDGEADSKAIAMFATSVILATEFLNIIPDSLIGNDEDYSVFMVENLDNIDIGGIY